MSTKQIFMEEVLTKQRRIASIAEKHPDEALHCLAHHIDLHWLYMAYLATRKDGAIGIDGMRAEEYEANLKENLESLLNRLKSGQYRAPAVRRVHIPKGNGQTRPLGIPTFEDKVLQRAVLMLIEPIFERDFYDFSYGFRAGKGCHKAMKHLRDGIMKMEGGWIIDLDIKGCFDNIDHAKLRDVYKQRVCDGVITRILGKWLKAGIMEEGQISYNIKGTPQGGVVSPLLCNIFLNEVLDEWFVKDVQSRMEGRSFMVRYADDAVMVFEKKRDAKRVLEALSRRMHKYGLELNEDKTKLIEFKADSGEGTPNSFDFLGFTLYWGKTRKGRKVVKLKTSKSRHQRALRSIHDWYKINRHKTLSYQYMILKRKIQGHYAYYGVSFNSRSLSTFRYRCQRMWHYWLSRRSGKSYISWNRFSDMLKHYKLPMPKIYFLLFN
ncbi:MAG: group II intron reverse transcriptase/maturase [Candidatus Thiodiazotropha endolucinida]